MNEERPQGAVWIEEAGFLTAAEAEAALRVLEGRFGATVILRLDPVPEGEHWLDVHRRQAQAAVAVASMAHAAGQVGLASVRASESAKVGDEEAVERTCAIGEYWALQVRLAQLRLDALDAASRPKTEGGEG